MSIDGSSETDGIDVCNMNLGGKFSSGIFVVQDGVNTNVNSGTKDNTNYKAVPWGDISSIFTPRLAVNNTYNIRK
jgi:3-phytase